MARLDQNRPIAAVLTGALDRFRVRRTLPAYLSSFALVTRLLE